MIDIAITMKTLLTCLFTQRLSVALAAATPPPTAMSSAVPHVTFDELPLNEGDPPYSAWGLFGKDDELGRINIITPEVTKRASSEVMTGEAIGLK